MKSSTLDLLQRIASVLVWSGVAIACMSLLMQLGDVSSPLGFVASFAGALERLAHIAGMGAIILVLAEIAKLLSDSKQLDRDSTGESTPTRS